MEKIRFIIRQILNEAMKTKHFIERAYDRLKSDKTNFPQEKEEIQKIVFNNIDFLSTVNFPGQDNVGILIFKGSNKYIYHNVVDSKVEHSEGSFVWAVVRGNDMETIVFGDFAYKPKNTQIHLNIDRLRQYIEEDKGGDRNLTEKDLVRLVKPAGPKPVQTEKPEQIIVNIGGVRWVVDIAKEQLYQKNKPTQTMNIWDALDKMEPAQAEELMKLF